MKTCAECGESKERSEYYANTSRCKPCERVRKRAYRKTYYANNQAKVAAYTRQWDAEHVEHRRELTRNWKDNNPGRVQGYSVKRRALKAQAEHEPYDRAAIFARWGNACAYCEAEAEHLDHVNPLSRGGADAAHNLVPACAPCNLSKKAKTLAEWSATF